MKIHRPTSHLVEVLNKQRDIALKYQTKLSKSEASTRSALIDPILRTLGWNTSNPNMVEFEKTIPPQSRVDYALLNYQNKIEIIIEAKPLGGNLHDTGILLNLVMYAFASGVKDIFLTDGAIWEHYTDYVPGNIGASKTLDLTKDNLFDCASYLISQLDAAKFWPADTENISPSEDVSQQLLELRNEISTLKSKFVTDSKPETLAFPHETINLDSGGDFIELKTLVNDLSHGKKAPTKLRLPDGQIKAIKTWRDILVECCYFVLVNNPSLSIPIPDKAGKSVNLFDYKPPNNPRIGHIPYEYNGKKIYIYINYDLTNCVENAIYVLSYLPKTTWNFQVAVKFSADNT